MALLGQEHGVRGEEKGGEIVETEVKPRDTDDKNHLGSFLLLFCRAILFTFVGGMIFSCPSFGAGLPFQLGPEGGA